MCIRGAHLFHNCKQAAENCKKPTENSKQTAEKLTIKDSSQTYFGFINMGSKVKNVLLQTSHTVATSLIFLFDHFLQSPDFYLRIVKSYIIFLAVVGMIQHSTNL